MFSINKELEAAKAARATLNTLSITTPKQRFQQRFATPMPLQSEI
jgi:hypothetical protein